MENKTKECPSCYRGIMILIEKGWDRTVKFPPSFHSEIPTVATKPKHYIKYRCLSCSNEVKKKDYA